jgi:kynurenine formamidase
MAKLVEPDLNSLLADAPMNWGKWGPDDEVGSLNYLTSSGVLDACRKVRQGKVFTLQVPIGHPKGDPVFPGRWEAKHCMVMDKGFYLAGKGPYQPGGLEYADDIIVMFLQGSTQCDALGHAWYDDKLWNGYDARTTIGGLERASILPVAERGVVGGGVLLDIARYLGKPHLEAGEIFDHEDLEACARQEGVEIAKGSILLVRTGWLGWFYEVGAKEFYRDFREPGLTYSLELTRWFQEMEIPNLVTDTIANEATVHPESGVQLPLHAALMRNLGVLLTEVAWLDDLAADCAVDGQYQFLYVAAPLKVVGGSGAPVNPIVLK